ncbi:methylated-DNA--[protein]-cysteine S-methyltransferase [Nocardiopsis potens]|uniref:methylated-DNA--[protein]-cysteine S-methyltransferase n=1 Tax=Nocardiopsis potens TaxID=1246458 RepID=UPI0003476A7E|nr:methylated-DNA--[protein]-cysteine S-methyltransferase [Nocardiopsis potens]
MELDTAENDTIPTGPAHAVLDSPVGPLTLVAQDGALTRLLMEERPGAPAPDGSADAAVLAEAARQLREYFDGGRTGFDLPLRPSGTAFQRQVWAELAAVPYGGTVTYGELAERIGRGPSSARAVGSANGANPIALVIPCHRVVGADGGLTGYEWGVDRKRFLLDLERDGG